MRSQIIEVTNLSAYSKDSIELDLNAYAAIRCIDAKKACFSVAHCLESIRIFASSSARTVIGKMTLQEILDNRSMISSMVMEDIKDELRMWGFTIRSFEIKDLKARYSRVRNALNKQINAQQEAIEKQIKADAKFDSLKFKSDAEAFDIEKKADGLFV